MDYGRMKELAEAFVGRGCKECPLELDAVLRDTASTGVVRMQWNLFCPVLHHRMEKEINLAFCSAGIELEKEDREMRQTLLAHLDKFENPPFTIQRLCELILQPKKHYKKLDCYMRAVEKNLLVVGTQEPDLAWMKNSSSQSAEKYSENEMKDTTTDISEGNPHSPLQAPPPPVNNDSPPTAPTSTWSNPQEREKDREMATSEERRNSDGERPESPTLLPSRKRSRDASVGREEDDKSAITVRQEADSTVHFESSSFNPSSPPFQVVDESPSKRSRESDSEDVMRRGCEMGEGVKGAEEKMETEGVLCSSSELMEMAATEETEAGQAGKSDDSSRLPEQISRTVSDGFTAAPNNKDVKPEGPEAMITN